MKFLVTQIQISKTENAAEKIIGSSAKAWRYVGEMEEIATTFREVGIAAKQPQTFFAK